MKDLFVTCPHGFEALLQKELISLGISQVSPRFCGVLIPESIENVFTVNYESRIATRVLWPIAEFPCSGRDDLYKHCRSISWDYFLHCNKTFAIDSNVQHPTLTNSLFAAMVVKDAICDFFRDTTGSRPSIDKEHPEVQLNLFIQKGYATLYLDTSGAPLHKRGWRTAHTEASLHESLAAALLLHTGYSREKTFCDPFCGSGTFLIEAAWIATNTPPGILRKKWGFFQFPDFDKKFWEQWKAERNSKCLPLDKKMFFGSDKSRETTETCKKNLIKAGLLGIDISYDEIAYYHPPQKIDLLVTNPPYGKRLETSSTLFDQLQHFLTENLQENGSAYFLCPEDLVLENTQTELSFKNGGLPVKLLSFTDQEQVQ
ncbi:MAG: N-6 DNA methylase [Rhabdochlamydiaceae bacterium]|nr:N-6 DNA methylase [Rhabdochlamydiaceae bacterium]